MKKKILIIAISIIILAMTIASATTAYFTDYDSAENVFTVGKVDISLSEVNEDYLGNEIQADQSGKYNFGSLYPGQTYTKIATIKNEGPENAYLAARITLTSTGLDNLFVVGAGTASEAVNVGVLDDFLGGLVVDGADYIVTFDPVADEANTIIVRVIKTQATTAGNSFDLMESVYVDPVWNNDSMAYLSGLSILIEAYGVQTVGFEQGGAVAAFKAAFPDEFPQA